MLLNISNHHSSKWTSTQMMTAIKFYGSIEDLAFPTIPPEWALNDIKALATRYCVDILEMNPTAVHLMGEMTFTYTLVNLLRDAGIPCVASTTLRNVTESNGKKIVEFSFVTFRKYFSHDAHASAE